MAIAERRQADDEAVRSCAPTAPVVGARRSSRLPWAELLRRVFPDDVLSCPCGGRRSIVAVVADPAIARTLLAALGLAHEPAAFAPARAPPQAEIVWDDAS